MAKFAYNGSPDEAKVLVSSEWWPIPPGKTYFDDLVKYWDEGLKSRGSGISARKIMENKELTVEFIVKHGAAGQNLSIAFGYEDPEKDL